MRRRLAKVSPLASNRLHARDATLGRFVGPFALPLRSCSLLLPCYTRKPMTRHEDIEKQADALSEQGADALRVNAMRQSAHFKRAWVEMAEVLVKVREGQAFLRWG